MLVTMKLFADIFLPFVRAPGEAIEFVATVIVCHDQSPVPLATLNRTAVVERVSVGPSVDRTVEEGVVVRGSNDDIASVPVVSDVFLPHRSVPRRDVLAFDVHRLADYNRVVSAGAWLSNLDSC